MKIKSINSISKSFAKSIPIFLLLIGCNKGFQSSSSNGPSSQTVGDLTFILQTNTTSGKVESQFVEGDNFMLTLKITNSSQGDVSLCNCLLYQTNPDLLGVYVSNLTNLKNVDSSNGFFGKPYNGVGSYRIVNNTIIPANSSLIYSLPWMPDTNANYGGGTSLFHLIAQNPLPIGSYYTQFDFSYDGKIVALKHYFTIVN